LTVNLAVVAVPGKDPVKRSWIVIAVDVVQFTVGNTLTGPIDGTVGGGNSGKG